MESRVGIFRSITVAEEAVDDLIQRGLTTEESITLLSRESPQRNRTAGAKVASDNDLDNVRTTPAGTADAGKNVGAGLGATIGGAAGFTAGATAASLMVPGLGVIFAIGIGAAALLGLGGAAAGAKVGDTIDREVDKGVPKEHVEFYQQLLRQGRSLVIVNVRGGSEISAVEEVFREHGSEDVETARRESGRAA
jgi:hypothetical protein